MAMNVNDISHVNRASIAIAEKHDIGLEDSIELMQNASLSLVAGQELNNSIPLQVAFLSALNAGRRTFLGGIKCYLDRNTPNLLPIKGKRFSDLVELYGGELSNERPSLKDSKLVFGMAPPDVNSIEVICSGWQGGVNFYDSRRNEIPASTSNVALGGVIGASLGLFYSFNKQFSIVENLLELPTGISLWDLSAGQDWHDPIYEGPADLNMPKNLWTVGLGHLGQAYLWTLGLMFDSNRNCQIALQDNDLVDFENIGSQILCKQDDIGFPKARVCSKFLSEIGFSTQIIEKPFLKEDQEQLWSDQYKFLLNGVDNIETRRIIDSSRFKLFLDGGTNGKLELFDSFTFRNFGVMSKSPSELWKDNGKNQEILHKNLYERIEKEFGCGNLINKGISTPFVGLFGATILISELLRSLNKGLSYSSISVQMRDLESIRFISKSHYDTRLYNLAS